MSELKSLKEISKFAGERIDLVQAGGGNTSVKLNNGQMYIKASGYSLSDVDETQGYSAVLTQDVAGIVRNKAILTEEDKRKRETLSADLVNKAVLHKNNRPSIETILHSVLKKYVLHTHPIVVNSVVIQKDWKEILSKIYGQEEIALVNYETPGIDLAIALQNEIDRFNEVPTIIFLQNHGLIISADNSEEVIEKTEYVLSKIEKYLEVDFSHYKLTTEVSKYLRKASKESLGNNISYLSQDMILNKQLELKKDSFLETPVCPDSFVYCGVKAVEVKSLDDYSPIQKYEDQYFEPPKIIIYQDFLFINAINKKKAKEIEEVLKFNINVFSGSNKGVNFLSMQELSYLANWEAEKYRQEL